MSTLKILAQSSERDRHHGEVEFVAEYPFNGQIYSGGDDGKLKIWNREMHIIHQQQIHEKRVYHAAFTQTSIFTCSNSPFIKEWTHLGPDGLVLKRKLEGHEDSVKKLRVSNNRLYSGSDDRSVRLWFLESGKCDTAFPVLEEVWDLKVDGKYMFTVRDRGITVWQTCEDDQRFMQTAHLESGHAPIALTPDMVYCLDHETSTKVLCFKRFHIWTLSQTIQASDRIIKAMAVHNDILFTGGWDQTLKAFDRFTGKELVSMAMGSEISAIRPIRADTLLVGLSNGAVIIVEFQREK